MEEEFLDLEYQGLFFWKTGRGKQMEDYSVLLFYTRLKGLQLSTAIPDVQLKFIF